MVSRLTPNEILSREHRLKEIALALVAQCKREGWITVSDLDVILKEAKKSIVI